MYTQKRINRNCSQQEEKFIPERKEIIALVKPRIKLYQFSNDVEVNIKIFKVCNSFFQF